MLDELEEKLRDLSHCELGIQHIQQFCEKLGSTKQRLSVWNQEHALVRRPIDPAEVSDLGFNDSQDEFIILQGDIVRTEAAYFMGRRVESRPKYAVLNSSCDLVSGRNVYATLLRISDLRADAPRAKQTIGELAKFARRDLMYVPKLPDDPQELLASAINFDGVCQIRTSDLFLANRVASLSLLGWRIFASFSRVALIRANPREIEMRKAVEKHMTQSPPSEYSN